MCSDVEIHGLKIWALSQVVVWADRHSLLFVKSQQREVWLGLNEVVANARIAQRRRFLRDFLGCVHRERVMPE